MLQREELRQLKATIISKLRAELIRRFRVATKKINLRKKEAMLENLKMENMLSAERERTTTPTRKEISITQTDFSYTMDE